MNLEASGADNHHWTLSKSLPRSLPSPPSIWNSLIIIAMMLPSSQRFKFSLSMVPPSEREGEISLKCSLCPTLKLFQTSFEPSKNQVLQHEDKPQIKIQAH